MHTRAAGGLLPAGGGEPLVQPRAQLVRIELLVRPAVAGHDHPGRGDTRETGESEELPAHGCVG